MLQIIFVLSVWGTSYQPMTVFGYSYPSWSVALGWLLRLTSVMSIPIYAVYILCRAKGTCKQRWKKVTRVQDIDPMGVVMSSSIPSGIDPPSRTSVVDANMLHNYNDIAIV
ncbi:hypothetical protein AB6A40_004812 [Gnathostoma spinigerum]|uniref:Uncharacterized protein n=1 Tax=Gnathostoma spinigerum TaxID=75299 RepID=A0ABD6EMB9_9BILA